MEKISRKELAQIIKEEYTRALKKQELAAKLNSINEEISQLEEVHPGEEMDGEVHDGQSTPEFDMKGSHIVETELEEGLEANTHFDGDNIMYLGQKVGAIANGKASIDPMYAKHFKPTDIEGIEKLHTASKGAPILPESEGCGCDCGCGDSSHDEPEFEIVGGEGDDLDMDMDDDMGFTAEPEGEEMNSEPSMDSEENKEKSWMFEGKNRMLKLGGLLNENED